MKLHWIVKGYANFSLHWIRGDVDFQLDMVIARCVIPVNRVFRTGLVEVKLSVDGGKNYPWWTKFYVCKFLPHFLNITKSVLLIPHFSILILDFSFNFRFRFCYRFCQSILLWNQNWRIGIRSTLITKEKLSGFRLECFDSRRESFSFSLSLSTTVFHFL